jgi:hypothetical protein
MVCSFILTQGTLGPITMWPFCPNQICTNIGTNYSCLDDYFEYLLGDPSCMGEEIFVMCWLGRQELGPRHDSKAMHAYNKMHVNYKVQIGWGIGGLKCKWRKFMKIFDSTKPKYNHLFKVAIILTCFLHKCHLDFIVKVISNHIANPTHYS